MRIQRVASVKVVFSAAAIALACVFSGVPAFGATLQSVSGPVLVNKGAGFKPTTGPVQIGPGDQVMAKPASSAEIVYADGCRVRVAQEAVVTVQGSKRVETSPCDPAGQDDPQAVNDPADPAGEGLGAGAGPGVGAYVVGAGIVGIGVAGVIANSRPRAASP